MATIKKEVTKRVVAKKTSETPKISKTGQAMRAGLLKGSIVELVPDPWGTGRE